MIKYIIDINSETDNLMQAIVMQHNITLGCEEIVATEPMLCFCPATGAVKQKIKDSIRVTVTLNDPNTYAIH